MGFDEQGQSSLEKNDKLRRGTRKRFFPKTHASPSFNKIPVNIDPAKKAQLELRLQKAGKRRDHRVRKEYLLYLLIIVLGILAIALLSRM